MEGFLQGLTDADFSSIVGVMLGRQEVIPLFRRLGIRDDMYGLTVPQIQDKISEEYNRRRRAFEGGAGNEGVGAPVIPPVAAAADGGAVPPAPAAVGGGGSGDGSNLGTIVLPETGASDTSSLTGSLGKASVEVHVGEEIKD